MKILMSPSPKMLDIFEEKHFEEAKEFIKTKYGVDVSLFVENLQPILVFDFMLFNGHLEIRGNGIKQAWLEYPLKRLILNSAKAYPIACEVSNGFNFYDAMNGKFLWKGSPIVQIIESFGNNIDFNYAFVLIKGEVEPSLLDMEGKIKERRNAKALYDKFIRNFEDYELLMSKFK